MSNPSKVLFTRRTAQLCIAIGVVILIMFSRNSCPDDPRFGWWLGEGVFLVSFTLTYMREERRATKSPNSDLVLNWNLAESIVFLLSAVGMMLSPFIFHLSSGYFYTYFDPFALGLLSGVALGEFLWQNVRLQQLDESCQSRYWDNYKNSIY